MSSEKPLAYLNKAVEIRVRSSSDETETIYNGTIVETNQQKIVVQASAKESFDDQTAQSAEVRILSGTEEIGSFPTKIVEHLLDPAQEYELIALLPGDDVSARDSRRAERLKLRIVGKLYLNAVKTVLLPSHTRQTPIPIVVRDISDGGAQILTERALPEDASVTLSVRLEGTSFEESAEIRWGRRVSQRFYLYGLRFTNRDLYLQQIVRQLSERPPSQGQGP